MLIYSSFFKSYFDTNFPFWYYKPYYQKRVQTENVEKQWKLRMDACLSKQLQADFIPFIVTQIEKCSLDIFENSLPSLTIFFAFFNIYGTFHVNKVQDYCHTREAGILQFKPDLIQRQNESFKDQQHSNQK